MSKYIFLFFVIPLLLNAQEGITYKSGEIIIKFKSPTSFVKSNNQLSSNKPALNNIISQYNISNANQIFLGREDNFGNYYVLQFPKTISIQSIKDVFKNITDIEFISENGIGTFCSSPNDSAFSQQWGLPKINAEKAWKITSGKNTIIVAAIENGIDLGDTAAYNYPNPHPDLSANLWNVNGKYGWNLKDTTQFPFATVGHGTHVAGIFGAKTNNEIGIAGIAGGGFNSESGVKVMMVKASNDMIYTESDVSAGIIWAADHGAKIINMSLGFNALFESDGEVITQTPSLSTLQDAVTYAYEKGIILIAAMGNEGIYFTPPNSGPTWKSIYPAGYSTMVISVAALNSDDSKRSENSPSNYSGWCTISAPGTDILSTWPRNLVSAGYANDAGTSMSAPFVSGLAALILSYDSTKTFSQVKNIITSTADDISSANAGQAWSGLLGAGRINAGKAMQSVAPPSAPESVQVSRVNGYPHISWTANTEYDLQTSPYKLYRKIVDVDEQIVEDWTVISAQSNTSYDDEQILAITNENINYVIYYKITATDVSSYESQYSAEVSINARELLYKNGNAEIKNQTKVETKPIEYSLSQNHPNPFNPTTIINYQIPKDGNVSIKIFDNLGREIATLVNEYKSTGRYSVEFDASKLSSGMYFYTIKSDKYKATKKMSLIK